MRPRTLRGRLTAAAALAVVLAVAFLAVCARLLVAHQLHASLDTSLRRRATDVARLSVSAPALLTAPGALESTVAGRQLSVEVLDRHGRFVARSLTLGAKLLPDTTVASDALRHGRGGFADVRLGSEPVRLYAAPLPEDGGPAAGGVVLVASSTTDIDQTLHRLGLLLLLSGLLAAGVGGAAAAVLTRRGLGPLARVAASATEIERTGDASRRLPDSHADDEVADLTRTLNRMLAALDAARLRERRFLADASHELRTPVTSLAGNVEFVARHGVNPEVLGDLQLDTQRLQRLVGDLLALERESAGPAPEQDVRLDAVVADAVAGRATARVEACDPVTVRGEPDALRRALDNLLDNAELHGPRGGEVVVSLTAAGDTAALTVRDEGPGLAAADLEHAFERFWRAPDAAGRPGSGLGLAIVRATAERHGGTVTVAGSTMAINLPAATPLGVQEGFRDKRPS
jgi:two-component system sensor histidine kinase MprB